MREIKFRGFNRKNNVWLYGFYLQNCGAHFVCPDEFATGKSWDDYEIDPDTRGEFTGRKDKNGKEIYEGDVVSVNGEYPKVVKYIEEWLSFCVANIDTITTPPMSSWPDEYNYQQLSPGWWKDFQNEIEVIGNIHDNPELLEQREPNQNEL